MAWGSQTLWDSWTQVAKLPSLLWRVTILMHRRPAWHDIPTRQYVIRATRVSMHFDARQIRAAPSSDTTPQPPHPCLSLLSKTGPRPIPNPSSGTPPFELPWTRPSSAKLYIRDSRLEHEPCTLGTKRRIRPYNMRPSGHYPCPQVADDHSPRTRRQIWDTAHRNGSVEEGQPGY